MSEENIWTSRGYYYKICECCGQVISSPTDDFGLDKLWDEYLARAKEQWFGE